MTHIPYKNRDSQLETSGDIVGFYEREFYCFSNFSSFAVSWREKIWRTSEHAYQAAKFFKTAPLIAEKIYSALSAEEAYKISRENKELADREWGTIKIHIMEDILRHKLQQHLYIKNKLLQTENKLIVEDSTRDDYWGWGPNRDGRNELGKLWMKLRQEIIEPSISK